MLIVPIIPETLTDKELNHKPLITKQSICKKGIRHLRLLLRALYVEIIQFQKENVCF